MSHPEWILSRLPLNLRSQRWEVKFGGGGWAGGLSRYLPIPGSANTGLGGPGAQARNGLCASQDRVHTSAYKAMAGLAAQH